MPKATAKPARHTKETPPIQSLDRGILILETVGKSPTPVSLNDLTRVLNIDRSSVFRLANTLKRRGFLANSAVGKDYVLGASVWRLSRQYDWRGMLATVAHAHLQKLTELTGETAHLAIREGRQALFIDHASATNHVISVSGQTGELVVSALPNDPLSFTVDKITPIAEAQAGRNVFRVEGMLTGNPARLRPGMEGVGKIDIGARSLAWIWLHPLIDWLRIWSWHWLP